MIQDTCRDFAEKELRVRAAEIDQTEVYPKAEVRIFLGPLHLPFVLLIFLSSFRASSLI